MQIESLKDWLKPVYLEGHDVLITVKNQVKVLGDVTPCSVVVGYQHFRGHCCLHLQCDWVETEASQPKRPRLGAVYLD